jgi:hypothetical protein
MDLTTTGILDLLNQRPGRYIQHDMGNYRIKDASGADVTVREGGKDVPIQPTASQIDDLIDASLLIREGSRYRAR